MSFTLWFLCFCLVLIIWGLIGAFVPDDPYEDEETSSVDIYLTDRLANNEPTRFEE